MIPSEKLVDPVVRSIVVAINDGDRAAFLAACTPDVTLSDDGSQRDVQQWIDREIFTSAGHIEVERQSEDGRELAAKFRNDTWGAMDTTWRFEVDGGKVARIHTGQA